MPKTLKFKTELIQSTTGSGWHFLIVEKKIERKFGFEGKFKRVVCSINGGEPFQCALMPWGGTFYIIVNKSKRDAVGVVGGDMVSVELGKDESKYGLPMPAEVREVLKQDPEGNKMFHALTPGKQRSMLYWLSRTKDIDRRIHKTLIFLEHLKKNDGKLDGNKLAEEMKGRVL